MSQIIPSSDLDKVEAIAASSETTMHNVSMCVSSSQAIVDSICSAALSWKQIDSEMHRFDLQFQTICKQMDVNLEMYKTRAPIVREQLNNVNRSMEKILDAVLIMDAKSETEMKMKLRYIDMVDNYMSSLTSMITKLL